MNMMKYSEYLPDIIDYNKYEEYCKLIQNNSISNDADVVCEGHHIVPKCFLPKEFISDTENIVYLSCEDHLLAHKLLYECTKDKKMLYAVYQMSNTYKLKVSQQFFENVSFTQIREAAKKMSSEVQKGKVFTEEHKKHLSESHKGYVMPQSQRDSISASNAGKIKDETWRKHLSESHKGRINRKYGTIMVHKEDKELQVWKDELTEYFSQGWQLGRKKINYKSGNIKDYVWMTNDEKNTRVHKDKVPDLELHGWRRGRCKKPDEYKLKEECVRKAKIEAARYSASKPYHKDFE